MWVETQFSFPKANGTYKVSLNPTPTIGSGTIPTTARKFNVVTNQGDTTSGTVALLATPRGALAARPVKDADGNAVSINLATADKDVELSGWNLESFSFTLADLNGTGAFTGVIQAWVE